MRKFSYALAALAAVFSSAAYADVEPFTLPLGLEPTEEEAARFIILDNNEDGKTWSWINGETGFMRYMYSSADNADDWFFIPVTLTEDDSNLLLAFKRRDQNTWLEKFEVAIGPEATPDSMIVVGSGEATESTWEDYEVIFENNLVGTAYIGIHCISDRDKYTLDVCAIQLYAMATPLPKVPVVTESNVEFLTYNALVTMPTEDIFGNALTATEMTLLCQVTDMEPMTFISQPGGVVEVNFEAPAGTREIIYSAQVDSEGVILSSSPVKTTETFIDVPGIHDLPLSIQPTEEQFDECTVINNNRDNSTWEFDSSKVAFRYSYNTNKAADDYLILPGISMDGTTSINIKFQVCCENPTYPEELEVMMGTTPNISDMEMIIDVPTVLSREWQEYEYEQDVPEGAETIYIAFHAISEANMFRLYVRNIDITASSTVGVSETLANGTVRVVKGGIQVDGMDGYVRVYGIDGRIAAESGNGFIALENGLYIVEASGKTMKVNIR